MSVLSSLVLALAAQLDPAAGQAYAELLAEHVRGGRVDYAALAKRDSAKLDRYLGAVAAAELPEGREARLAFWIDAYNALVLRAVIDHGRPRSVLDVKGFFTEKRHRVAGETLSLDMLEKERINPLASKPEARREKSDNSRVGSASPGSGPADPRTHFVLVCAAVGCPILEPKPFVGSPLEPRLDAATRRYLASPAGARVSQGRLELSMIFEWYAADFGGREGVLAFVRRHLPPEQAKLLGEAPTVSFFDYNWTLNQR